jgi:hypothetical protein
MGVEPDTFPALYTVDEGVLEKSRDHNIFRVRVHGIPWIGPRCWRITTACGS